jgi:uncharacterized protein
MGAFLILHGWENRRPPGHWQYELARSLRERGERVVYPQLPDTDNPTVGAWGEAVEAALAEAAEGGGRVTVICHSLSCLLWLGARPDESAVDRVLLVAPPSRELLAGMPTVAPFAALTPTTPATPVLIAASDADPFSPGGAQAEFGTPLGIPVVVIPGGGHLVPASGYGEWPSVLAWCLDATATLRPV